MREIHTLMEFNDGNTTESQVRILSRMQQQFEQSFTTLVVWSRAYG